MTKKLLPTVIGMILAGGVAVAQADVQLMGHIDESINYINGGKYTGNDPDLNNTNFSPYVARGDTNTQLVCTTCSVGVKGSEDLGNGLKALFFLDWQFDMNGNGGNNGGLTSRDQYLGLGGNFGTLKAGTMSTVYKSYGAMLDPVYRTVAQQRDIGMQSLLHSGRGSDGQGRATNTVGYETPNWNGLSAAATTTIRPDSDTPSHNNPYSAGVKYENGGILVFGDYVTNNAGGDDSAYSVGAKWTINNFSLFGQYEFDKGLITDATVQAVTNSNTDLDITTLGVNNNGDGADVWMVGGTYTMGNNLLYAGYGAMTDSAKTTALDGTEYSVGKYESWEAVGIHNFSKRTLAYLGYVGVKPDNNDYDTVAHYTLGVKHTF